jgi:hypothetical protein
MHFDFEDPTHPTNTRKYWERKCNFFLVGTKFRGGGLMEISLQGLDIDVGCGW